VKNVLKNGIAVLLAAVLCLCLAAAACAEESAFLASGTCGAQGVNMTWALYESGALVIDGEGAMADFGEDTAPWYNNRQAITSVTVRDGVTSVGLAAFSGCSSLASVTLPESVTSIGDSAFCNCSSLTAVTIPEGLTIVNIYTFSGCSKLTSVTIPESVTVIGDYAFRNCSSMSSVMIPEGVANIGNSAFSGCGSLTSAVIPEGVTSIGNSAFSGCVSLTSVTLPESVTSIGNAVFSGCSKLTGVTLPAGVTSIGGSVFSGCSSLTRVTIPEGVASIGASAFYGCSGLINVTIPEGVTSIGEDAFYGCSSLTSVTIPARVTSIRQWTFFNCSGLTSVTIPESVTSIGQFAFNSCAELRDVYYSGSQEQWAQIRIGGSNSSLTDAVIHYGVMPDYYTVSYEANGGTDAPEQQTKTPQIALTLSGQRPTRGSVNAGSYAVRLNPDYGSQPVSSLQAARITSYRFREWNTAADGSRTSYAPGDSYSADADLTLYAQWDSSTETAAVTLPELSREDALFLGWGTARDAEDGMTGAYTPDGNVTLYALWLYPDLSLPASLTAIEAEGFAGGAFRFVKLPEGVVSIGSRAFASCPNLRHILIPAELTEIASDAFDGVEGLTILGTEGSAAERYAAEHGFAFLPVA